MRPLVYHVATTLDGFLARPDHTFDCFANEGDHVTEYVAQLQAYDTVVMGRRTYEVGLRAGVTDPYPWMDTWVFSRTLTEPPSPRVHVVGDDATATVAQLKEREGSPVYLCGGGTLAAALFDAGLVDEVWVKVNPLVLGEGVPFAPGLKAMRRLALQDSKTYESGVILARYAVLEG